MSSHTRHRDGVKPRLGKAARADEGTGHQRAPNATAADLEGEVWPAAADFETDAAPIDVEGELDCLEGDGDDITDVQRVMTKLGLDQRQAGSFDE